MPYSDNQLKKLYLNGKKAGGKSSRELISALNNRKIRTEKGGYLFKAGSDHKNLYLAVIPCIIDGERTHHYDIVLPESIEYFLTGSITPEGVFTILFIPKQKPLSREMKRSYHSAYIDLALGLLCRGLDEPGELDGVSRMMLVETEVMTTAPDSLLEMLNQERSIPRKS
ncbi:MAG: hypothetical protein JEZ04_03100 [Spirochaetales bacterium]|nr:hypothetical protein [Spirochaetales bacterium]